MMPVWKEPFRRNAGRTLAVAVFLASVVACSGCKLFSSGAEWGRGEPRYARVIQSAREPSIVHQVRRPCVDAAAAAELAGQASKLEMLNDPKCVDLYFSAACRQWAHVAALGDLPVRDDVVFESRTYNAYLAKLLVTAQRHRRLDPTSGLHVVYEDRPITVPVELHGFSWTAEDFNEWELVGEYRLNGYSRPVRNDGVGVPLLVRRCRAEDEQFHRRVQPFAATAVLRTRAIPESTEAVGFEEDEVADAEVVLEFYDPAHCRHLVGKHERWIVAGDLTAPWAWTATVAPNSPITAFLRPESPDATAQLVMLEPYQPGKIPVVFVHGLASDPTTWLTTHNSLRAQAWFRERYQVWAFRYPTGMPFLKSAATLRRELQAALSLAPGGVDDPAARQMVLIGHSMGGLVSKLQVTDSGTELWDLVADRPLEAINADEADRERLRETFFFTPQPYVRKVIFIGTPHRGSSFAADAVGRVSSWAAKLTTEADARHRRLVADNPGVFNPWIVRKVPTSVDLLRPNHPLLQAIEKLPVASDVQLHSIIGVADTDRTDGPGDGVVPLTSARHRGVTSEKLVSETHQGLHEAASTAIEIERILERQLRDYDQLFDDLPSAAISDPLRPASASP